MQILHRTRHRLAPDAEKLREFAVPERVREDAPPWSLRPLSQLQEPACKSLNDALEHTGLDLCICRGESAGHETKELMQEVRTTRESFEELFSAQRHDVRGLQRRCPIVVGMVAKAHLPEHVIGTKNVDSEFISAARHRHLLYEARSDQDQAICWFARFEDWLRSSNMFDWSAEECGTQRASHQVRQIEAVRVMASGRHAQTSAVRRRVSTSGMTRRSETLR